MHRRMNKSQRPTLTIEYEIYTRHSRQVLAVIIPAPQGALGCEDRDGRGSNAPVARAFPVSATYANPLAIVQSHSAREIQEAN